MRLTSSARPLRLGLVGAGFIAGLHVGSLAGIEGVEVAAVADPLPDRAEALAARVDGRAYPDHRRMLDAEPLDGVYVCVPPFAHGPPELAAIDAGLPLFVEKPVAIDEQTAASIATRLAGRPLVTCTGYHWRWLDIFDRAAELLADRPARLVQCSWLDKVPPPTWWLRRDGSGGQTIEQTTHVLDLARGLAGEVTEVHAFASRAAAPPVQQAAPSHLTSRSAGPRTGRVADGEETGGRLSTGLGEDTTTPVEAALPGADVPDVSVAGLRFASGAVGTVASTCLLPRLHRAGVQVVAEGLSLELSETELLVKVDGRRTAWRADADARPRPDRDFVAAVRGGPDRIRVPWAEAYRTHLLACAITRSAEERRPLAVSNGDGHG